jgi:ribose 5-phosphate isomerase B
MRIAVGGDHAGYELKGAVVALLREAGHEVLDLGPERYDPDDDYPDFAATVAAAVRDGRAERGVLVCGSGIGACVAANKLAGVRATIAHDTYSARQGVEHDDVNVLCLGARVVGSALARDLVLAFVGARFSPEERHVRRLKKVLALEAEGRGTAEQGGGGRGA